MSRAWAKLASLVGVAALAGVAAWAADPPTGAAVQATASPVPAPSKDGAVPARPLPVPGAVPPSAPISINVLDVLSLRDPFKRVLSPQAKGAEKSPLERYPTASFKMIGVISGTDHYKAVLQSPDGENHIVGARAKVGPNGGRITKITDHDLVVKERVTNVFGQIEEVSTSIELVPESKRQKADNLVTELTRVVGVQPLVKPTESTQGNPSSQTEDPWGNPKGPTPPPLSGILPNSISQNPNPGNLPSANKGANGATN